MKMQEKGGGRGFTKVCQKPWTPIQQLLQNPFIIIAQKLLFRLLVHLVRFASKARKKETIIIFNIHSLGTKSKLGLAHVCFL